MGKPAARIGDWHICPKVTPGTPPVPHMGGAVTGGCLTVLIEGQPAAREGDSCFCIGEPDMIITGSSSVFIGGKPAARMGDQTAHGGKIMVGCVTVVIGEKMVLRINEKEKIRIINEAIEIGIILLENKLQLLERNDSDTLASFQKWFGWDDEVSRWKILERIKRTLKVCTELSIGYFSVISNEKERRELYARYYPNNSDRIIYLGDKFWGKGGLNKKSRAGVIIHELSHFSDIGSTEDVIYGRERCLKLARDHPSSALINAESFEYFVLS